MRLASTGWPEIWQGTVPVVSAIGCSIKGAVLCSLLPLALRPAFLPFGPLRPFDRNPRFSELNTVLV